jgi:NAD(P) transhydrogenase
MADPRGTSSSPTPSTEFDLVVIGSGPAGYRAAMQAAKMNKSIAIVEMTPDRLGGAWIHTGTIPSKTLRESMDTVHAIRSHAGSKWVERIIRDLPAAKLMGQALKVAQYEEALVRKYCDRYKIQIVQGFGTIEDRHTVRVVEASGNGKLLRAENILVATGSRPRRPTEIPFDGWRIVDGDEILKLETVPKSLLVYGAGVIGCEYACIFGALGVDVTIIDGRSTIMQYADQETALALKAVMEKVGIKFALGSKLAEAKTKSASAIAKLESGAVLEAEVLFFAAGRTPNTDRIGLSRLGIKTSERGEIVVNENFQTNVPNVYAAGDVIGLPALAATSNAQGRHAALHMFGAKVKAFPDVFPVGIYTIPELSSVGANEQELVAKGVEYVVGRAGSNEVARGYIRGDEHGLLKLLVCKRTHKILGIHILGHDACNLVHIGLAFMQKGGHAQDFIDMVFNYPTLAEAYRIAAFNALNKIFIDGEIGDPPDEGEVLASVEKAASKTAV